MGHGHELNQFKMVIFWINFFGGGSIKKFIDQMIIGSLVGENEILHVHYPGHWPERNGRGTE